MINSISESNFIHPSNLQTAKEYSQASAKQDVASETESSYHPSEDPSKGNNIDITA